MLPTIFSFVNFVGSWAATKLAGRPGCPSHLLAETCQRKNDRIFPAAVREPLTSDNGLPPGETKCPPGAVFRRAQPRPQADRFAGRRCRGARIRPIGFGNRMPNAGVIPYSQKKTNFTLQSSSKSRRFSSFFPHQSVLMPSNQGIEGIPGFAPGKGVDDGQRTVSRRCW